MKVLKLNKKENEKGTFNESDYLVLNYNQLLSVNGAKGGSSGPSSPSGGDYDSSSGSPSSGSPSSGSSSSSGKGGGQKNPSSTPDPVPESTPDPVPESIPEISTPTKPNGGNQIENSVEAQANAKPGDILIRDDGSVHVLNQGDINWAKEQIKNSSSGNNSTPEEPVEDKPATGSTPNSTDPTNTSQPTAGNNSTSKEPVDDKTSTGSTPNSTDPTNTSQPTAGNNTNITQGDFGKLTNEDAQKSKMQDFSSDATINNSMHGENNKFSTDGCKMQGASKIITEISGSNVDITKVNKDYDKNADGFLTQTEIKDAITDNMPEGKTLAIDHYENMLTTPELQQQTLKEISEKEGTTYVLGRAEDVHGGQHWIVLEGYSVNDSGQVEFNYNGTSINDNGRKYILGEPTAEQKDNNYYRISKIETYTVK